MDSGSNSVMGASRYGFSAMTELIGERSVWSSTATLTRTDARKVNGIPGAREAETDRAITVSLSLKLEGARASAGTASAG